MAVNTFFSSHGRGDRRWTRSTNGVAIFRKRTSFNLTNALIFLRAASQITTRPQFGQIRSCKWWAGSTLNSGMLILIAAVLPALATSDAAPADAVKLPAPGVEYRVNVAS